MSHRQTPRQVPGLIFVIMGTMFNTIGIVMISAGWARYVIMAAGLVMLLFGLLTLLRSRTTS